jgi:hypothetical protein
VRAREGASAKHLKEGEKWGEDSCDSRNAHKSETYLLEMGVGGEGVVQAELAHDDEAGEIGEGNARLVAITQPRT